MTSIVWFRQDLRLGDQAALAAALAEGLVIPVYVLDDETPRHRRMGAASRWWLHHSLDRLDAALRVRGSRLIRKRGKADEVLAALADETSVRRVHALRHYEPWWRNAERAVGKRLNLQLHDGNYLAPPGSITTGTGGHYKIYTPFWRSLLATMPPALPVPDPVWIAAPVSWPESDTLADWALLPTKPDWTGGFSAWKPGEEGAVARLDRFAGLASRYGEGRNFPSIAATSFLSPHLHFGEISPATVWRRMMNLGGSVETFLGELGWRDFAANVIAQYPDYGSRNARPAFDGMSWRTGAEADRDIVAWQRGETGYPIVDAGMRELWATGWMHNRVRMIAASFLVKHLLIDWRVGEQWFWDTLVDADYASNAVNWQWTAGTGLDSNMFARIMAPLVQSEKFDAAAYIRRWVPELKNVPDAQIHDPEKCSSNQYGYPAKIIGHRDGRERALAALRAMGAS